jgi:hypothetical protein
MPRVLAKIRGMTEAVEIQDARCLRCGRQLRAARSVEAGYGRTCQARIRAAALAAAIADFTVAQVEKARELIADGGLVPTNRAGVYRAVRSRGDVTYLVTPDGVCNCAWALRSGLAAGCYHVAAARILDAAKPERKAA